MHHGVGQTSNRTFARRLAPSEGNFNYWRLLFFHSDTYFQAEMTFVWQMEIILDSCHGKGSFSGLEHIPNCGTETNLLEKTASEPLDSIMKQLVESNGRLHDAEFEIVSLKEKVGLLEISIESQRGDLEISERSLNMANDQASEMEKKVEPLKYECGTLKYEKIQALNNDKLLEDLGNSHHKAFLLAN
uniref:Uncharacterized protein n=1 Tax=Daucus carota subsp. sativus TaxID=79200 RepID=A0A162A876_DAUCS